jgi:hypothetical protein
VLNAPDANPKEASTMLETIIIVLLILWLLGFLGPAPFLVAGNWIHLLLVVVLILIIIRLL